MQLIDLGWDSFFDNAFIEYKNRNFVPARVARVNRTDYLAYGEKGGIRCEISGRYRHEAESNGHFPTVGDWVAVTLLVNEEKAVINALLPRRSAFIRKAAGFRTDEQVVASNIDTTFIVVGLDGNFNLRRIERYLAMVWESGSTPVVLLNKADLCGDSEERRVEVESIAVGVDVHTLSAAQKPDLEIFDEYIRPGRTAAFLGSSGVGKSTIINCLLGTDVLKVGEVSDSDGHGRHTTTHRELILLPKGGIVIDTPGMREIQVWGDEESIRQIFDDIEMLAAKCRFRDCRHHREPGCAVQAAISDGSLDSDRLRSYLKLQKEFRYLAARQAMKASAIEKERWKKISVAVKLLKGKG